MHLPSRARRILKWTGVTAGSVIAIAAGVSVFSHAFYRGNTWVIVSEGGDIRITTRSILPSTMYTMRGLIPVLTDLDVKAKGAYIRWQTVPYGRLSMPSIRLLNGTDRRFIIPYWLTLSLFGGLTLLVWHRDRRRIRPGHCLRCGYDLTGNTSGVCPECGGKACPPAVLADSECGKAKPPPATV